jgi:hypothetical protein
MTGRSVKEWIGRTPDSKVPDHVRLRIFRNADGVCHISKRKIGAGEAWQLEHVIPLSLGGEHRESNLRPALGDPHKGKSAEEADRRAKADAAAKRHIGIRPVSSRPLQSRGFASSDKSIARKAREPKARLKPRDLYE